MEDKLLTIGMYADQTGLFSESELNNDNWCNVLIPESILRKWYEQNELAVYTADELDIPLEDATFERWLNDVSYGDDTDGLFYFSILNGYEPRLSYDGPATVQYVDSYGRHVLMDGTWNECRQMCRDTEWVYTTEEREKCELEVIG